MPDGRGKPVLRLGIAGRQRVEGERLVRIEGRLRAPVSTVLRDTVAALLRGGERQLVVDLSRVADLDAAGIGELVCIYTMAASAGAVLRVERPTRRVHALLDRAGLVEVLGADPQGLSRAVLVSGVRMPRPASGAVGFPARGERGLRSRRGSARR